jgi:hypothetical protein
MIVSVAGAFAVPLDAEQRAALAELASDLDRAA